MLSNHAATSRVQPWLGWMAAQLNNNKYQMIESESSKGSGKKDALLAGRWMEEPMWMILFYYYYLMVIS